MSRLHFSVPLKSKALRMTVPVIAQTCVPSVTGDGDDMFCFISWWLPPPSGRFHRTVPLARSTHQRCRLSPVLTFRSSATFRKMRSPQMTGVDPDQDGSASFQVTFSVADQRSGRFFSPLTPFNDGPRHCGQFSAAGTVTVAQSTATQMQPRRDEIMCSTRAIGGPPSRRATLSGSPYISRLYLFRPQRIEQRRAKRGARRHG